MIILTILRMNPYFLLYTVQHKRSDCMFTCGLSDGLKSSAQEFSVFISGFSKLNFNPKSRSPGPYMLRGPIYVTWFVLWAPSRLDWVLQSSAYKFWPTKRKISPRIWLNARHSPNPETHLLYGPTYVIGLLWFKDENVFPINKYILFIPP